MPYTKGRREGEPTVSSYVVEAIDDTLVSCEVETGITERTGLCTDSLPLSKRPRADVSICCCFIALVLVGHMVHCVRECVVCGLLRVQLLLCIVCWWSVVCVCYGCVVFCE